MVPDGQKVRADGRRQNYMIPRTTLGDNNKTVSATPVIANRLSIGKLVIIIDYHSDFN